ncbi:MAG: 50S ribosomal protein L9, partial [Candidatus Kapaibacterium sp.]
MKVILRQNQENLGTIGETIEVKDGYARNFLIPRDIAYRASPGAIRAIESEKKRYLIKMVKFTDDAKAKAALLENVSVTLGVKVGEDERIFGSITTAMIADELSRQGHT